MLEHVAAQPSHSGFWPLGDIIENLRSLLPMTCRANDNIEHDRAHSCSGILRGLDLLLCSVAKIFLSSIILSQRNSAVLARQLLILYAKCIQDQGSTVTTAMIL
jgi:hypothetical protein